MHFYHSVIFLLGEDLPDRTRDMAYVQYGDTFVLIGGYGDTSYKGSVQLFDPDTLTFTLLDERLTQTRDSPTAILVREEMFPECE